MIMLLDAGCWSSFSFRQIIGVISINRDLNQIAADHLESGRQKERSVIINCNSRVEANQLSPWIVIVITIRNRYPSSGEEDEVTFCHQETSQRLEDRRSVLRSDCSPSTSLWIWIIRWTEALTMYLFDRHHGNLLVPGNPSGRRDGTPSNPSAASFGYRQSGRGNLILWHRIIITSIIMIDLKTWSRSPFLSHLLRILILKPTDPPWLTPQAAHPYFREENVIFLCCLMIAVAVESSNVHQRIALGILCRTGTNFSTMVLAIMATTALFAFFINNSAAAAMMMWVLRHEEDTFRTCLWATSYPAFSLLPFLSLLPFDDPWWNFWKFLQSKTYSNRIILFFLHRISNRIILFE